MKPTYALKLSPDGIGLWHRTSGGWHMVGEAELDDPELSQRLEFLRRTAAELDPSGISTKLVIPNSQILYRTIDDPGEDGDARSAAVLTAMEGATPYPIDQLAIDWQVVEGEQIVLAAVARETLREADAFAADYRFNAISFVAQPEPEADVTWEPFFGETVGASDVLPKGESVDRDATPLPWPNAKVDDQMLAATPDDSEDPEWQDAEVNDEETNDQLTDDEKPTSAPAGSPLVLTGVPEMVDADADADVECTAQDDEAEADGPEPAGIFVHSEPDDQPGAEPDDAAFEDVAVVAPDNVAQPEIGPVPIAAKTETAKSALTPAARSLAGISDVGMSSRAQVILGLILIFLAILLWASIFLGGKLIASWTPVEQNVVVEHATDASDLAGQEFLAQDVPSIERELTYSVSLTEGQSQIATPVGTSKGFVSPLSKTILASVPSVDGALLANSPMARLDSLKGMSANTVGDQRSSVPWPDTPLDKFSAVDPGGTVRIDTNRDATWLDVIKVTENVNQNDELDVARIVLAQAFGQGVKVSDMPGRRLISRDVSPLNLGAFTSGERLEKTDQVFARLPGTEITGPKVRRAGDTAVPQIGAQDGAKRVASLPPRQDVRLDLPVPDLLETIVATKWSSGENDQLRPQVPAQNALPLIASISPVFLNEFKIPDPSQPVSKTTQTGPEPLPEPVTELTVETNETPADPTFVALRPLLAERPTAELIDTVSTELPETPDVDTDQAVETALAASVPEPQDLVSDLPARLRPEIPKPTVTDEPVAPVSVAALAPRLRPADVGNRSVASTATRSTPRIPTSADVAKQATQTSALKLGRVNLIGIMGTTSNRMALVRMSNGRVLKVKTGDRLDGGMVTAVTSATLQYKKNGKTHTLAMPRG